MEYSSNNEFIFETNILVCNQYGLLVISSMATKYDNSSSIPEKDSSEELEGFVAELPNSNICKGRPGIRSHTYTPDSSEGKEECRMRNKTVRAYTDDAFELISEDDDKGIEWEKINWVMIATEAYTTEGKKDTVVRKGEASTCFYIFSRNIHTVVWSY